MSSNLVISNWSDENNPEWHMLVESEFVWLHERKERVQIGAFDEDDTRAIISWVAKNHPEIIQDIVCEDCPEVR